MIDKTENREISDISQKCSETGQDENVNLYQILELHRELDYLKGRLALVPEPVQWCCKHLRQFWWTLSSLVGLGWLHNGARPVMQNTASNPTIRLPSGAIDDMPSPRLFLDVTITYKSKLNTGVQRVIRELCRYGEIGGELAPVIIDQGVFVSVPEMTAIDYREGDKILLLDSGWTHTKTYLPALNHAKSRGVDIILGIYDLIPIQHPGFVHPYFTELFDNWLKSITPFCRSVLAISRYSAESYHLWADKHGFLANIQEIGWFHLGADFPEPDMKREPGTDAGENIPANFLLSVGTLEPRKGYACALDAFDLLWRDESTLSYVIIGRRGDLALHIVDRIVNHPQFGKKLFWPQNVDDHLLALFYKRSQGVLIPALAEGFGLPLIEACQYGKPVIASNLQVFREIAPPGVTFFEAAQSMELAQAIENMCDETKRTPTLVKSDLDWNTATKKMLKIIKSDEYQLKF